MKPGRAVEVRKEVPREDLLGEDTDLAKARKLVLSGHALALVKGGTVLYVSDGNGLRPLLEASLVLGKDAAGASLGDRVVGLAVARVALHLGVAGVYGGTGSQKAGRELDRVGVPYLFDRTVPAIMNRDGTGPCPMETLASVTETPGETYEALLRTFGMTPVGKAGRPEMSSGVRGEG